MSANEEQYPGTPGLMDALNKAQTIAIKNNHTRLTLEHVLAGLLNEDDAIELLEECEVDIDALEDDLLQELDNNPDLFGSPSQSDPADPSVRALLQAGYFIYEDTGKLVTGANLVALIMEQSKSPAAALLSKHGFKPAGEYNTGVQTQDQVHTRPRTPYKLQRGGSNLQKFCTNLNERAINGKTDPLIGRDSEVSRTVQVLSRRKKNNPMLVGDPGVGKTAIAEGLARRIIEGDVPASMEQATIFSLDMGALVAGTQFRGQFEERLKGVIQEAERTPGAILFIDEIHTVMGAGNASGGTLDAGNILKPALANGDIRAIGATTFDEYKQFQKKDKALMRRFQKIDIPETTPEATKEILYGIKERYEQHHNVTYTKDALDAAVELSNRYIHDRKQPDKAIDVIDEAGSAENMDNHGMTTARTVIDVPQIETVVAKIARIPPKQVSQDERKSLSQLGEDIKEKVFDQDAAVNALVSKIKINRAGLRDPKKPIGSFLFTGPTGVGKTEVAKQLAETLGMKMERFDMSEYMEKHSVSGLIGAPPGYVGHDQGGQLTDKIDRNPYTVLLLDEIEKAHPDVYNILLQVMDNGFLTDKNGKEVSFRNVILIMTSNAGAAEMEKGSMAIDLGIDQPREGGADQEAIAKLFTPEFRNRLDATIPFSKLKPETMKQIVGKFLGEMEGLLKDQNIEMEISQEASDYLAVKGYDPKMGARPMSRVIEREVKEPLSDEILNGKLQSGGKVKIAFNEASKTDSSQPSLTFEFEEKKSEPAGKSRRKRGGNPAAKTTPSP